MMLSGRVDRALISSVWPQLEKVDHINFQSGDVLLVCGGFEDRVMTILERAAEERCEGLTIIDFEYLPSVELNRHHDINRLCDEVGWHHSRVEYDRCNPSGVFDRIIKLLPKRHNRIYIDISGMSRLLIVQALVGILDELSINKVSVLYTEAESYPPSESEAESKISTQASGFNEISSFLSYGVFDLAILPELSATGVMQSPIHLIAFPSFNPAQLVSAKSIIQPANMTLINGVPPSLDLRWREDAICKLNGVEGTEEMLSASTLDYSDCLKALLIIYEEWSEFNNLVISPTGSKMQSVGVGIFRGFMHDVQIIYPTPLNFTNPLDHTHGAKQVYELQIDFFVELKKDLINQFDSR